MSEDIVRQLRELQQSAAALRELIAAADAASPESAEGRDRSGAVRVVLGRDGGPESVRVQAGWQGRLAAAGVGAAVVEATEAAAGARMAAWVPILDGRAAAPPGDAPPTGPGPGAGTPPLTARGGPPRSPDVLAEEMIRALGDARQRAAASPLAATGTGASAAGRVTVSTTPEN